MCLLYVLFYIIITSIMRRYPSLLNEQKLLGTYFYVHTSAVKDAAHFLESRHNVPVQIFFLTSSRIRVDLLLYESKTIEKQEQ